MTAACVPWPGLQAGILQASTLFIPLEPIPEWAKQFCKFTIDYCIRYHHFQVAYDDQDSLQPGRPHMIGGLLPAWQSQHASGRPRPNTCHHEPSGLIIYNCVFRSGLQPCDTL